MLGWISLLILQSGSTLPEDVGLWQNYIKFMLWNHNEKIHLTTEITSTKKQQEHVESELTHSTQPYTFIIFWWLKIDSDGLCVAPVRTRIQDTIVF